MATSQGDAQAWVAWGHVGPRCGRPQLSEIVPATAIGSQKGRESEAHPRDNRAVIAIAPKKIRRRQKLRRTMIFGRSATQASNDTLRLNVRRIEFEAA